MCQMGDNDIIDLTHTSAEAEGVNQNQNNDIRRDRGGRRKHPDWEHIDVPNKKCKYCRNVLSTGRIKIERVERHLNKCREYLQMVQTKKAETVNSRRAASGSSSSSSENDNDAMGSTQNQNEEGPSINTTKRNKKTVVPDRNLIQETMDGYVIKTNQEKARKIDLKIANFFYACNIPFSLADHPAFLEMMEELRPSYKPPSRKLLAGKLLDDISDQIDKQMTEELTNENNNRAITILQDGWSNIRNCPIIATSIHTGKKSYLLSATDCGSEKKTAEYCTQLATESIESCKTNYNKDVFAMVTDNENKMKKLRQNITEKYPKILTYGCSSHYLNLLENKVSPKTVLKHIVEIQTYWRNHHQPGGWLREKKGMMPQIPNDTRWNSQLECVRTYNQNYTIYREIIKEHADVIPLSIRSKIDDVNIYKNSLDLEEQLKVVGGALDRLQGDNVSLADAVDCWRNLAESSCLGPYKDDVLQRFHEAMQPFHYVAYMTDPKYLDKPLPIELENEAENWLSEHYPNFLNGFMLFKIKDPDFYPKHLFNSNVIKEMPAQKWWSIMESKCDNNQKKEMAQFFAKLHSCPASSAAIERIFSTFGLVWSKLRNNLGAAKVEKLVKIYRYSQIKYNKNKK